MAIVEVEVIFPVVDDDGYGGRAYSEWVAVAFAATATNPPTIEEVQGKGILPPLEEGERYGAIRTREIPAI